MLASYPNIKKWSRSNLLLAIGLALSVVGAGCTQAGAIQLPPLPQAQSANPTTETPPEPTVTNAEPEANLSTAAPTEVPVPEAIQLPGRSVFQFQEGEPAWYTVDDSVMGGVSNSKVSVSFSQTGSEGNLIENYRLLFSGTMSLDNNGGFSSARSDWVPINLEGYDGILLRVLGDGKSYRLRIRSAELGSGISYNALFNTEAEKWTLAYVPFEGMVPTRFGYVMNVGKLNPATIASFGLMLSDKQPGEFALEVDWMRAVTTAEVQSLSQSLNRSE